MNKTMEPDGQSIEVMNEIITNISRTLSISVDDIKSKSRKRELVEARVIFVNFCENAGVHPEMVINFINRHRTMIYYLRKAYTDWQSDVQFQKLLAKFDESEKTKIMGTTKLNELKKQYEFVCNEYVTKFCKKQEMDFEGWVADSVGGIACCNDFFFNFQDIVWDMNSKQQKWTIVDWYSENLETPDKSINYFSYTKGLRASELE